MGNTTNAIINGDEYVTATLTPTGDVLTYCIVRTYSAGVWAGFIKFPADLCSVVYRARRLWKWNSKFTLSELSIHGVKDENTVKFAEEVKSVGLTQVIEVIPCTDVAQKSIVGVDNFIP